MSVDTKRARELAELSAKAATHLRDTTDVLGTPNLLDADVEALETLADEVERRNKWHMDKLACPDCGGWFRIPTMNTMTMDPDGTAYCQQCIDRETIWIPMLEAAERGHSDGPQHVGKDSPETCGLCSAIRAARESVKP